MAIAGGSGGQSVAIADVFAEAGLRVPLLTQKSYDELATFFVLIGGGYRNPIDTGNVNRRQMRRILEILERDTNIDSLVLLFTARWGSPVQLETQINSVVDIRNKTHKPMMAILSYSFSPGDVQQGGDIMQKLQAGGVPTFVGLERGARALKNALDYYSLKGNVVS